MKNIIFLSVKDFEESEIPAHFFCSIDPKTAENNFEYIEGHCWDSEEYRKDIEKDFKERFFFVKNNKAAIEYQKKKMGLI